MQLWLIPLLPLAGFLLNGLFGRRFPKPVINVIAVGSRAAVVSVGAEDAQRVWARSAAALKQAYIEHYYTWIQSGTLNIGVDFAVDRLTAVMLMIVTGVGSLIHIYSVGYMAHEGGYYRFFAYLNLFMFFMLMLVLGANFLMLFVGWEGVGLCSYLLIGFYFLEKFATDAGNKAFIVNRIGDFGFSLAMFLIVAHFGSLDFGTVFAQGEGHAGGVAPGLDDRDCAAAAGGRHRQIGADSALCLAARRHGRSHAGQRPDPRGHHGDRGRLHDRRAARRSTCTRPRRWISSPSSASRRRSSPPPSAWRRTISRRSSLTRPCRSWAICSSAWARARSPPASST